MAAPLPKTNVSLLVEGNYRQINSDAGDAASELGQELNIKANLQIPVWGNLSLSPFVDFYRFKGLTGQPIGKNVIFGFGLDFSRLWKPLY
ncbi:MAG: hypothetical protein HY747_11435 [Elusimicrobia bacterium]|nr:hypothetical protein [Elusimicrobiota bacterium]